MSHISRTALVITLAVAANTALGWANGNAAAQMPPAAPSITSFAVSVTPVKVGASTLLTMTVDQTINPYAGTYSMAIVDADSGADVSTCSGGSTCTYYLAPPYSDNTDRTRHFRAEVRAVIPQSVASSAGLSVPVQRATWNVSAQATANPVTVGSSTLISVSLDRTTSYTGYQVVIVDDETGQDLATCQGSACSYYLAPPYALNKAPQPRRLHAEVRNPSTHDLAGSASIAVNVRRWVDPLTLTVFSTTSGAIFANAYSSKSVSYTGYSIDILQDDHTLLASCSTGTACSASYLARGHTYRAVIEDSTGWALSTSGSWTLPDTGGPTDNSSGAVDLLAAAALFPTAGDVCDALLVTAYGTHLLSSASDQYLACTGAAAAAGATAYLALRAIAGTMGGDDVVTRLVTTRGNPTVNPGPVPAPSIAPRGPGGGRGPDGSGGPAPLPVLGFKVSVADNFMGRYGTPVTVPPLTQSQAEIAAEQCLHLAALAGNNPLDECLHGRVFISGNDVQSATDHDLDAIVGAPAHDGYVAESDHPQWAKLNYESGSGKSRTWLTSDLRCAGQVGPDTQCDEYPFLASEQGGQGGSPSLRPILAADNGLQGTRYGNFVTSCRLAGPPAQDPGDPFLVIPIPQFLPGQPSVPTIGLCAPGDRP